MARTAGDPGHNRGRALLRYLESRGETITSTSRKTKVAFAQVNQLIRMHKPNPTTRTLTRLIAWGIPLALISPDLARALTEQTEQTAEAAAKEAVV